MLTGLTLACTPSTGPVASHHDVTLVGDRIAIDTNFSTVPDHQVRLALLVPLPEYATIAGATPELGSAGVVSLLFDRPHGEPPSLHVEVDVADVESTGRLPLPVV